LPPKKFAKNDSPAVVAAIPERVPRHSLVARAFHWVMAISMFALLITAFPAQGRRQVRLGHLPLDRRPGADGVRPLPHLCTLRFSGLLVHMARQDRSARCEEKDDASVRQGCAATDRFAKYPLENKFYHAVILLAGLAVIITGVFMMKRVNTGIFVRNPYLFGDMTWGMMYVLHGLAGVGLIALIMVHVYFGIRPEKLPITKSMIFGYMEPDFYLEEHDPQRWAVEGSSPSKEGPGLATGDD
jgi:cytochrome b subunit of formate dehydrogenase